MNRPLALRLAAAALLLAPLAPLAARAQPAEPEAPLEAGEIAETLENELEAEPAIPETPPPIEPDAPLADTGECGEVVIAEFGWTTARLSARVLAQMLTDGYGCLARRAPADPERALIAVSEADSAIRRGIAPVPSEPDPLAAAATPPPDEDPTIALLSEPPAVVALGVPVDPAGGDAPEGVAFGAILHGAEAGRGWFTPEWFAAANPDIATLDDLAGAADRFAARPGDRPRLYLCPAAWPCHAEDAALAAQLGLAERFELVTPASGEALTASLLEAWRARRPWLGSYWTPAEALAGRPMRRLAPGSARICPGEGAPCVPPLQTRPRRIAYPKAFGDRAPKVARLLDRFTLPPEAIHEALAWRAERNATLEETALHLLQRREDLWRGWTGPEAAERFAGALELRLADLAAAPVAEPRPAAAAEFPGGEEFPAGEE